MRLIQIFILLLLLSCSSESNKVNTASLKVLGLEKTEALNQLSQSFDQFIELNYSKEQTRKLKYRRFLEDFKNYFENGSYRDTLDPKEKWKFDIDRTLNMAESMELSKMRHEIMYYPLSYYTEKLSDEDEKKRRTFRNKKDSIRHVRDSIRWVELDNRPEFNFLGLFLQFLTTAYPDDICVNQYVDAKLRADNVSPAIIAEGAIFALENERCRNSEGVRTFIAVEFYYFGLVDLLLKREKTTR